MTENETKGWAALAATYQQCVNTAIETWDGLIGLASLAQQKQAEEMRDRRAPLPGCCEGEEIIGMQHEIPVPLFTPRDRLQFLKEVSVTLLIEASKRGLSVSEPVAPGEATVPFGKTKGTPISQVSGIELESMVSWIQERPDRSAKYADFMAAAANELQQRAAKAEAIQTQPLDEKPLALLQEAP